MGGIGTNYIVDIRGDSKGSLYAAEMMGTLWRSVDDGATWVRTPLDDSLRMHGIDFRVTDLTVTSSDRIRVSGFVWYQDSLGGVYESSDAGSTWNRLLTSPRESGAQTFLILPDNIVIAGTRDKGFYWTEDFGETWHSSGGGFSAIVSLVADTGQIVLAGSMGSGVIRSTNSGLAWAASNTGLTDLVVRTVKNLGGGHLFAGTDAGGFVSSDHGASWEPMGPSGCGSVRSLFTDGNGDVYLITAAGIFRGTAPTSVERTWCAFPLSGTALLANYPNPFNPATAISYQLAAVSEARLAVYDLLGREVAVLVNQRKAPGSYTVTFDAAGRASGIYFYRLSAGSVVQTRKMLLVR
jgi:photosystem II stability/assembly factor-like uncharacterized protein